MLDFLGELCVQLVLDVLILMLRGLIATPATATGLVLRSLARGGAASTALAGWLSLPWDSSDGAIRAGIAALALFGLTMALGTAAAVSTDHARHRSASTAPPADA